MTFSIKDFFINAFYFGRDTSCLLCMKYVHPTRHEIWRNTKIVLVFYGFLFYDFVHVLYKFGGHMTL